MNRIMYKFILMILLMALSGCSLIPDINFDNHIKEGDIVSYDIIDENNSISIGLIEKDTFNPLKTRSTTMSNLLGFVFEPLFSVNDVFITEGVLAQSYQISPDGMSVIVNLKKNVKWHNNDTFTVDDVLYTINKLKNDDSKYSKFVRYIVDTKIIDEFSFKIIFKYPCIDPAALLSFPIIKNNSSSDDDFKLIGTGPFYVMDNELNAFEDYHNSRALIDKIDIISVHDESKYLSLLNANVIEISDSDTTDMSTYMPKGNATVYDFVSNKFIFVGFNSESIVFKHPEARRCVSKIINRKDIVSKIYYSRAEIVDVPINPKSRFYSSHSLNEYSDISFVQDEMTSNGWALSRNNTYFKSQGMGAVYFSVNIIVNSEDEKRVKVSEMISDVMNKNGMKNNVIKCTPVEFQNRLNCGNYDMFIGETVLLPNNDLTSLMRTGENVIKYSSEKTDAILSQLGTMNSDTELVGAWQNLCDNIQEEMPLASICFLKESLITGSRVNGVVVPSVENKVRRTEKWRVR